MTSAYLLVSHGSRDPGPAMAMGWLARLVSEQLASNQHLMGVAALELQPQELHEQIQNFAEDALSYGCDRLVIIPLFLSPGVHVVTDIPREVNLAQETLSNKIIINLQSYLGTHPGLVKLLGQQMAALPGEGTILLAHGSRRGGALDPIEAMAENLGAITAYWSVAPGLKSRIQELVAMGNRTITILPYFLFSGGITDAIARAVEELQLLFPGVSLQLAAPLGASPELAEIIKDLIHR